MSGHSKWSQIKHKKAIADSKKGASFGKIAQAISLAARANPDPSKNLRLKGEIERAHAMNMPNDSIQRAIKRVTNKDASALSEIQIELIGPGNSALIIHAITDNSNRTIGDLKKLAMSFGAHMTQQGAVLWMFKRVGILYAPIALITILDAGEKEKLCALLEAINDLDDVQDVVTNADLS